MAEFTIIDVTETKVVVEKTLSSLADQTALRQFIASEFKIKVGEFEVRPGGQITAANQFTVTPAKGHEADFTAAVMPHKPKS